MKKCVFLVGITLALIFFVACGSDTPDTEEDVHIGEGMETMEEMAEMPQSDSMKTSDEWIRSEPVNVQAVDENQDGFVYQDPMDWNVIADEEGKCPKCNMSLVKVTVDEAVQNLKDNGFTVQ
ncbi:MAG: heavy metal-binding domain-containing protein [Acidobacteriota bacterium]|jgi:uncharacterized protein with PIN domain